MKLKKLLATLLLLASLLAIGLNAAQADLVGGSVTIEVGERKYLYVEQGVQRGSCEWSNGAENYLDLSIEGNGESAWVTAKRLWTGANPILVQCTFIDGTGKLRVMDWYVSTVNASATPTPTIAATSIPTTIATSTPTPSPTPAPSFPPEFMVEGTTLTGYAGTDLAPVIPEGITVIEKKAFYESKITSITLPSTLRRIGNMAFAYCALESIEVPEGVFSIQTQAFARCNSLVEATLPSTLEDVGSGIFQYCDNLKRVTFADGPENIGADAFNWCSSLETVRLPRTLTSIKGFAFEYCQSLKYIDIPEGVKNIYIQAFNKCDAMKRVVIPPSVTSIGTGVFGDGPEFPLAYVWSGSYAEQYVQQRGIPHIVLPQSPALTNLETLSLPSDVKVIADSAFEGVSAERIILPAGVRSIGSRAFARCPSLAYVNLPDSLVYIADDAFEDSSGLVLACKTNSLGIDYAIEHGFDFVLRE